MSTAHPSQRIDMTEKRLRLGWSIEKALFTPVSKPPSAA